MTDLRRKTLHGIGWMAFSQVISQGARFGFIIALARLLTPADFGLWGMALVFTGFAALLGDIGLGAALIQRSVVEEKHLNTAFWVNIGMGLLLTLLMIALSVPLSKSYGVARLVPILAVASTEFIIKSAAIVHRVHLVREMNFRSMAIQETVAMIIAGISACALAASGWGAWSLVAQNLIAALIVTLWLVWMVPWRPSLQFDFSSLKELLDFSLHLQGFNLVNYVTRNFDKFLIGRLLGEVPLGFYTRAYNTMLLPQTQITGVLERVMWPALARCAHDPDRLRHAYLRALMMVCFIGFPCMAGLAATADTFVIALFGEQWRGSIITLRWLCIAGFMQTPVATLGWLYLATGRTRRLLAWSGVSSLVILPAMIMGALSGNIEGMARWYTCGVTILAPLAFLFAAPIANIDLKSMLRVVAPGAAASATMAMLVRLCIDALPLVSPIVSLMISGGLGVLLYLLFMFKSSAFAEAMFILRRPTSGPESSID